VTGGESFLKLLDGDRHASLSITRRVDRYALVLAIIVSALAAIDVSDLWTTVFNVARVAASLAELHKWHVEGTKDKSGR